MNRTAVAFASSPPHAMMLAPLLSTMNAVPAVMSLVSRRPARRAGQFASPLRALRIRITRTNDQSPPTTIQHPPSRNRITVLVVTVS